MKTRTGKIARLPQSIRDQLNQKLENSVPGNELLPWLHRLPEVQKMLADHFQGRPITKSNLSDWRLGGFADWKFHREGRQQWWELIESARDLTGKRATDKGVDVSSYLGTFLLVEVGQALDRLHTVKDMNKRWKLMRLISGALSRLRNDDTREKMLRLREIKQLSPSQRVASSRAQSCLKFFFCNRARRRAPTCSRLCPTPPNDGSTTPRCRGARRKYLWRQSKRRRRSSPLRSFASSAPPRWFWAKQRKFFKNILRSQIATHIFGAT